MNIETKIRTNGNVKEADLIYCGGDIVTINDTYPSAEALAIRDGKIIAVGTVDEVMAFKGPGTKIIDLGPISARRRWGPWPVMPI